MKFIYTAGPYTEFRGYVFSNGRPTEVADRATVSALNARKDFVPVMEATKPEKKVPVLLKPMRPKLTLPVRARK